MVFPKTLMIMGMKMKINMMMNMIRGMGRADRHASYIRLWRVILLRSDIRLYAELYSLREFWGRI